MVITFAGVYGKLYCVYLNAELFSCAEGSLLLLDTKHRDALDSRGSTVSCCFHQRGKKISSLIEGFLKYKHKEKPKSLNYDVKIGPIEARSRSG